MLRRGCRGPCSWAAVSVAVVPKGWLSPPSSVKAGWLGQLWLQSSPRLDTQLAWASGFLGGGRVLHRDLQGLGLHASLYKHHGVSTNCPTQCQEHHGRASMLLLLRATVCLGKPSFNDQHTLVRAQTGFAEGASDSQEARKHVWWQDQVQEGDGEELSFSCLEFSIFFLKYFIMSEYHFIIRKAKDLSTVLHNC